jgi:inner membrane protein
VYRTSLEIACVFAMPDLADLRIDPTQVEWSRSELVLGIADVHAIQSHATATWDGVELRFRSGPGSSDLKAGIHAPIAKPFVVAASRVVVHVDLNGSRGLYFTPVGEQSTVTVTSNWPSPSFQGNWLPGEHRVGADGFRARWQIPFLGRNQPPAWTSASPHTLSDLGDAAFGVDLVTPVDAHRMSERSVKYARLFVLLTFGVIWLIEVLAGVRVHPIQYLLIGGALCTFYLLELSLAEQLGFATAYVLAGTAVVGLVGLYAAVALGGWSRALAVGGTIGALYGYLYVLLTNEDYALLLGSLGVFAAVAATMLLTRKVDWYADRPTDPAPTVSPTAPAARA